MADSLLDIGGESIFPLSPNWATKPKQSLIINRFLKEYPGTATEMETLNEETPIKQEWSFSVYNKADELTLLEFIHDHKGRIIRFWVKYQSQSFILSQAVSVSSSIMYVEHNEFQLSAEGYERIFIEMNNGDIITRHVTAVTEVGDELLLDLTSIIDRDIGLDDYITISRLLLVRFDDDDFSFKIDTDKISDIDLRFYELVKEYSELAPNP